MNKDDVINQLEQLGSEQTKKILKRHGAKEPLFGVKIGDLKKISKNIKRNNELIIELYDTGIYDAMYLAGISINTKYMNKESLIKWMYNANCYTISEYTVPSVTAETEYAIELANLWIDSDDELISAGGWSTYSNFLSIANDEEIDLDEVKKLLEKIKNEIHNKPDRVRYTMNGFIISVGAYIKELTNYATEIAESIGTVKVNMGETSCKVAVAKDAIEKIVKMNRCGMKRKSCRC